MQLNQKSKILLTAIVLVAGLFVYQRAATTQAQSNQQTQPTTSSETNQPPTVSVLSTTSLKDTIQTSGRVEAQQSATIASQVSGVIDSVVVDVGDQVSAGQTIARFSNADQQANVRQAEANLASQQARLDELRAGPRPQEQANAQVSVTQAREALEQAQYNVMNTDLQAYVASGESAVRSGSLRPPTISGSYEDHESGTYTIRLYKSGSKSGYSFRYSGLEDGFGTVSTGTPQPLGTRGLYIQFPENFAANQLLRWEVPIPNTRSSQYQQAQNNVTQARNRLEEARNNSSLTASGTRPEQIQQQEAQVAAAQASLESAQSQLAKTAVTAPFTGVIQSVPVSAGEYRSVGQEIAELVNTNRVTIETTVSPDNAQMLVVGDKASIHGDIPARIQSKSPAVGNTGSIAITLSANPSQDRVLTPGTFVDVAFPQQGTQAGNRLPLSAVGTTANGDYVLVVNENNTIERVSVQTGSVTGESVMVSGSLPDQPIIADISGLSAGDTVQIIGNSRE